MTERLVGPRLKLARAKAHLRDLDPRVLAFLEARPYDAIMETDPQTGENKAWFKLRAEPDPCWALLIGDALHNLRSALDLLYWQLVENNGNSPTKRDSFLISDSKTEFDRVAGPVIRRRAGKKAFEIIRDEVQPYDGGNRALWCLHKLDIVDKHRLLLVVAHANPEMVLSAFIRSPDGNRTEIATVPFRTTTPWPLKDGDPLPMLTILDGLRTPGMTDEMDVELKIAFAVTLYEPAIISIPEPLWMSLNNMEAAVERTIDALALAL